MVIKRGRKPIHGVLIERLEPMIMSFATNGTEDPVLTDADKRRGLKSVTRTDVGTLTVKLYENFTAMIGHHCEARLDSGTAEVKIVGAPSLNASGGATIPIVTYQESSGTDTATDLSANANNRVCLTLWLTKSPIEG